MNVLYVPGQAVYGVKVTLCSNAETLGIERDGDNSRLTSALRAAEDAWRESFGDGYVLDLESNFAFWNGGRGHNDRPVLVDWYRATLDYEGEAEDETHIWGEALAAVPEPLRQKVDAARRAAEDAIDKAVEGYRAEDEADDAEIAAD